MPSFSLCSSARAAAPVSAFAVYSGERVAFDVFEPLNSLASGAVADAVFDERRRFRGLWGMAKSTVREKLESLGDEAIGTGEWGLEDRSVRAGVALDVAVEVWKSAI